MTSSAYIVLTRMSPAIRCMHTPFHPPRLGMGSVWTLAKFLLIARHLGDTPSFQLAISQSSHLQSGKCPLQYTHTHRHTHIIEPQTTIIEIGIGFGLFTLELRLVIVGRAAGRQQGRHVSCILWCCQTQSTRQCMTLISSQICYYMVYATACQSDRDRKSGTTQRYVAAAFDMYPYFVFMAFVLRLSPFYVFINTQGRGGRMRDGRECHDSWRVYSYATRCCFVYGN